MASENDIAQALELVNVLVARRVREAAQSSQNFEQRSSEYAALYFAATTLAAAYLEKANA